MNTSRTQQPDLNELEFKPPTTPLSKTHSEAPIEIAHHRGLVIGILSAALIIILIGLFFWFRAGTALPPPPAPLRPTADINREPESTTARAQVESFSAVSTSDELTAIEADLESTDLDSLESELQQIEIEITNTP